MGTDIRWIIERKHEDGSWHAVMSKTRAIWFGGKESFNSLGLRNYQLFGILSGLRYIVPDQVEPLARPGLPVDTSHHAIDAFSVVPPHGRPHTPGRMTLRDVRDCVEKDPQGAAPGREDRETIRAWKDALERSLERLGSGTLFGRERGPDWELFPDMRAESHHAKLARLQMEKGLRPIDDDTLRILIAYLD